MPKLVDQLTQNANIDGLRSDLVDSQLELQMRDGKDPNTIFFHSNEFYLFAFYPTIKDFNGAILGVGSDQILDMLANTSMQSATLVDFTRPVTSVMKTLLEVGTWHHQQTGDYPKPHQFIRYFDLKNLPFIRKFAINVLGDTAGWAAYKTIAGGLWKGNLGYAPFMRLRASLEDTEGNPYAWYSTPQKIEKVISLYEQGQIIIATGDLCDPGVMEKVSQKIENQGNNLDVLYLSNAEMMIQNSVGWGAMEKMWENLMALPLSQRAVIIRTTGYPLADHMERAPMLHPKGNVLNKIYYDWHYNLEEVRHHKRVVSGNPLYTSFGWPMKVKGQLDSIGTPRGFSYLLAED